MKRPYSSGVSPEKSLSRRNAATPGSVVPPHWHPTDQRVVVLRGTMDVGMGEVLDRTRRQEDPGWFVCDVAGAHATLCMGARRNDHAGLRRRYLLHQHGGGSGRVRTSASTRLRTLTGRLTTANVATFSKPEHLARFERGARLLAGLTMLLNRPTGRQAASQARQVAFVVLSGHSRSKHQARQGPRTESRTAGCDSSPQLLARRSRRPTQAVERLEIS